MKETLAKAANPRKPSRKAATLKTAIVREVDPGFGDFLRADNGFHRAPDLQTQFGFTGLAVEGCLNLLSEMGTLATYDQRVNAYNLFLENSIWTERVR